MNTMIVSDSFKGTLSSSRIADIFEESFRKHNKVDRLVKVKIADGGEGTIDAFKDYIKGELVNITVKGPHFQNVNCSYYLAIDLAIIEVASCASLSLAEDNLNPSITTSYGVGEEIIDAINKGAKKIIIALGGSSTNDGGAGILSALGVIFKDKDNNEFIPTGGTLNNIAGIDYHALDKYKDIEFILMSDCTNPTFGASGAAYIFAPQKGADIKMVKELDNNLRYFSDIVKNVTSKDYSKVNGTGAAGAIGFGLLSFLNAKIKSGIETLLEYINFDELLDDVDIVFTGEGKFDSQSLNGKVISGILNHTIKKNKKVIIVSGSVSKDVEEIDKDKYLIKGIFSTNRMALDYSLVKADQDRNYYYTIDSILSILEG